MCYSIEVKNITKKPHTTVTVANDDLIDLYCLKKYHGEPMVDVIRRLIKSYAGVSHIDLEERRRFFTNGRKPSKKE